MNVLFLIGTPREAIALAPVVRAMQTVPDLFETRICITSSRTAAVVSTLSTFELEADCDLGFAASDQTFAQRMARVLEALDPVVTTLEPDWLMVRGDGVTALAGALVAYFRKVRLAHVEAGMRTYSKFDPFPLEMSRRLVDLLADRYFAATERDARNLEKEGIDSPRILLTGSTSVDARIFAEGKASGLERPSGISLPSGRRPVLISARHLMEDSDARHAIQSAMRKLATAYRSEVQLFCPAPTDPDQLESLDSGLGQLENFTLLPRLDYVQFIQLLRACHLVLTDSSGLQVEASSMGKPVLMLRTRIERLEALTEGTVRVIGTDEVDIIKWVQLLLDDPAVWASMAQPSQLYGDGRAADRIVYEFERRWKDGEDI